MSKSIVDKLSDVLNNNENNLSTKRNLIELKKFYNRMLELVSCQVSYDALSN